MKAFWSQISIQRPSGSITAYLEKLMDLYEEDQGGTNPHFKSIMDCFWKAIAFDTLAVIGSG
jgi:hypothetical protein